LLEASQRKEKEKKRKKFVDVFSVLFMAALCSRAASKLYCAEHVMGRNLPQPHNRGMTACVRDALIALESS
jgi:hypothetical protein